MLNQSLYYKRWAFRGLDAHPSGKTKTKEFGYVNMGQKFVMVFPRVLAWESSGESPQACLKNSSFNRFITFKTGGSIVII